MLKERTGRVKLFLVALLLFLFNLFLVIILKHDPKDTEICEHARKSSTIEAWESYLEKFPKGWCVWEAQSAIERAKEEIRRQAEAEAKAQREKAEAEAKEKEEKLYKEALKKNSRAVWENYLREFQEGEHASEAESKIKEMKKVDTLEWSNRSRDKMDWNGAEEYCKNLSEDGYNDWRLPNIDELRTLIKDRKTVARGACIVSEQNSCLDKTCWTSETCNEACPDTFVLCDQEACHNSYGKCTNYRDGRYSKLGDYTWIWSSSTRSDNDARAWSVIFYRGSLDTPDKSTKIYVRCVRGSVVDKNIGAENKEKTVLDTGLKQPLLKKKRYKTIEGIEWSDRSSDAMSWEDAKKYCEDLPKDDNDNEWRLPDIDELRTLVQNCPKTETSGECKVSEKNGCLSDSCFFSKESGSKEYASNCSCDNKENNGGYYSKLSDSNIWLWSSSVRKGYNNDHWNVYFGSANVMTKKNKDSSYVRCVR